MLTLQEYIGKVKKLLIFCFPIFVLFCILFVSHMPAPTDLKNPTPKMEKPLIYEVKPTMVRVSHNFKKRIKSIMYNFKFRASYQKKYFQEQLRILRMTSRLSIILVSINGMELKEWVHFQNVNFQNASSQQMKNLFYESIGMALQSLMLLPSILKNSEKMRYKYWIP